MANSPKAAAAKKAIKKSPKKSTGPKRPLSAYMFFAQGNRANIMKQFNLESKQIGDIGKKTGEAWAKMSEKDKLPYQEKANKDKVRYESEKAKA